VNALELGQLGAAVHAQCFPIVTGLGGDDGHALSDRGGNDIGKVVLALGVVVGEAGEPSAQCRGGRSEDAGVDFMNGARGLVGVFVLDDSANCAALADDAAVAGGVGQVDGEKRQGAIRCGLYQAVERGRLGERHIAIEDKRGHRVDQVGQRLHDGVTGAALRRLQGPDQIL
jgi:hypothetical protein